MRQVSYKFFSYPNCPWPNPKDYSREIAEQSGQLGRKITERSVYVQLLAAFGGRGVVPSSLDRMLSVLESKLGSVGRVGEIELWKSRLLEDIDRCGETPLGLPESFPLKNIGNLIEEIVNRGNVSGPPRLLCRQFALTSQPSYKLGGEIYLEIMAVFEKHAEGDSELVRLWVEALHQRWHCKVPQSKGAAGATRARRGKQHSSNLPVVARPKPKGGLRKDHLAMAPEQANGSVHGYPEIVEAVMAAVGQETLGKLVTMKKLVPELSTVTLTSAVKDILDQRHRPETET